MQPTVLMLNVKCVVVYVQKTYGKLLDRLEMEYLKPD